MITAKCSVADVDPLGIKTLLTNSKKSKSSLQKNLVAEHTPDSDLMESLKGLRDVMSRHNGNQLIFCSTKKLSVDQ